VSKRDPRIFHEEALSDPELNASLSIDQLVWRHIDRTNISAMKDEGLFAANVRALLSLLPKYKREEIEERREEYITRTQEYVYKYFSGVPIGTPENPICGSPTLVENEEVDWYRLYELILDAFEETGISWKYTKETIELGMVEEKRDEPTPYFFDEEELEADEKEKKEEKEEEEEGENKETSRICFVCKKPLAYGSGTVFWKKLVHKGKCLDKLKVHFFEKFKDKVT